MTIQLIYQQYNILPNLQRHMLQVAAVGEWIYDHWNGPVLEKEPLINALLLHDMGNIIKFRPPYLGEMADDEEYWLGVQREFVKKYGPSEHSATEKIIHEINPPNLEKVLAIYHCIGWHNTPEELSWEGKIADYADCCVAPQGVVGFEKRMEDLLVRYKKDGYEEGIVKSRDNAKDVEGMLSVDKEEMIHEAFAKTTREEIEVIQEV